MTRATVGGDLDGEARHGTAATMPSTFAHPPDHPSGQHAQPSVPECQAPQPQSWPSKAWTSPSAKVTYSAAVPEARCHWPLRTKTRLPTSDGSTPLPTPRPYRRRHYAGSRDQAHRTRPGACLHIRRIDARRVQPDQNFHPPVSACAMSLPRTSSAAPLASYQTAFITGPSFQLASNLASYIFVALRAACHRDPTGHALTRQV